MNWDNEAKKAQVDKPILPRDCDGGTVDLGAAAADIDLDERWTTVTGPGVYNGTTIDLEAASRMVSDMRQLVDYIVRAAHGDNNAVGLIKRLYTGRGGKTYIEETLLIDSEQ